MKRWTIEEAADQIRAAFPPPLECEVEILDRGNGLGLAVRSPFGDVSAKGLVKSQVCDPQRLERIIAFVREALEEKAREAHRGQKNG